MVLVKFDNPSCLCQLVETFSEFGPFYMYIGTGLVFICLSFVFGMLEMLKLHKY